MSHGGAEHWDRVYGERAATETSWHESTPRQSIAMLDRHGVRPAMSVIDVGGGTSSLTETLIARGHHDLTVLDVSTQALHHARQRLGSKADTVEWITADITTWQPDRQYDVWHDRAVLHFLTTAEDQAAYSATLRQALSHGGVFVVATFAPSGPTHCSGLPVARHDADTLQALLGPDVELLHQEEHEHATPWGTLQPFTWIVGHFTT